MFMFNNFAYPMKLDHGRQVSENEWSYGEVVFFIHPIQVVQDQSNPHPPKTTHLGNSDMRNQHDIQQASFNPVVSMDTSM